MSLLKSNKRVLIIFFVGVTSVYPTLWGKFIFDDGEAIVKNDDVTERNISNYKLFKNDFWGVPISHPLSHKSYRPLTTLSFRLDYYFWGENPIPFHLFNLLIHGLNCVLVYYFLRKCLATCCRQRRVGKIAFWASLIFSVHPIHVEPLGGLVGRADLLSSFIFLLGFILIPVSKYKFVNSICITIAAVFGALFKENSIVLVILYCVFDVITKKKKQMFISRSTIFWHLISVLGIVSFIFWRLWFQGGPPTFQPHDNPPAFADNIFAKASSILYIWALNVYLLINPTWLCYDWSMGCIELVKYPFDLRFIFTLAIMVIGLRLFYLSTKNRIILLSLVISGVSFLPSSNLIFTVGFVLAERNLYLPSIGYSLLISYAFLKTKRKNLLIANLILFYLRSLHRSVQWTDQALLFKSALLVCPNNAKVHYNLGTMYGDRGSNNLAIKAYKKSLQLKPDYYQAMNNVANILRTTNNLQEAEHWLKKAVQIKVDFAAAWMNLGIVLSKKDAKQALQCYKTALTHRKFYPDCEYNMGNLYLDIGENDQALKSWIRATSLKPTHLQAWVNIIIHIEKEGNIVEAKEWAYRALKYLPQDDNLNFLLANILGKLKEYDKAKDRFHDAIDIVKRRNQLVPAKYYVNLGVLHHHRGKKKEAAMAYKMALTINPNLESAKKNLEMLDK